MLEYMLSFILFFFRVLDTYRNKFETDKLSRSDLVTRKDINNIKNLYHINIQDGARHENDVISVDLCGEGETV